MKIKGKLYKSWESLWVKLKAKGSSREVFNELCTQYETPPRTYHNLTHIAHCLDEFDSVRHLANNPGAVEWALWFHDAIYDSQSKMNEEESAKLAYEVALKYGLSSKVRRHVTPLVMATTHAVPPTQGDEELITDIDLAILGQLPERFDEYERHIRQEYLWVDDAAFAKGRSDLLEKFLARPTIYQTEWFINKYEKQARENLMRVYPTWKVARPRRRHKHPTV